ncbi:toxin-antitoxin system YwqK family antitoxin [Tellurirhabdus rosea]|uniref:toxin-antitoxin system YwqK family antitoxin n=1 Tax=Tellurirhabdus rosea TaxID=2674997 RepID=UPI002256E892|nr:hypothetical protein [Tellurirhabdus rosea]
MSRIGLINILLILTHCAFCQTQPATTSPSSLTTAERPNAIPEAKKQNALETVGKMLGVQNTVDNTKAEAKRVEGLVTEDLPDLGLKLQKARKDRSEKKKKIKLVWTEYEGIPIAEAYTKYGSGDKTVIEKFTVLKQYRQPSPYVRETYWFDPKEQRVKYAAIKDKDKALILHGPYKRYQNGNLVEEGFYYVGAKDGRWERYDANFQLLDKIKYHHGFPAESQITYYDSAHTKIKEVLPKEYGKIHGTYLAFYETGALAAEGRYDTGVKVGRWTEYYPGTRRMRKRVVQYGRDRWEEESEPLLLSEWDEKGKVVYERPKEKAGEEEQ